MSISPPGLGVTGRLLGAALALTAGATLVLAQDGGSVPAVPPNPKGTIPEKMAPPEKGVPPQPAPLDRALPDGSASTGAGPGDTREGGGQGIGGVIVPPTGIDPEIQVPAPDPTPGTTPVIPPPGTPGNPSPVVPK